MSTEDDREQSEVVDEPSETLALDASNFVADCKQTLLENLDKHTSRFALAQWVANSPNRDIFLQRKQEIADTLELSMRQVERILKSYHKSELKETSGTERSDKGEYKILPYWVDYIRWFYDDRIEKRLSISRADVVREVERHAEIDLQLQPGEYPHRASVYRVLAPVVARAALQKKIRNPGSGSWFYLKTRDGEFIKIFCSNQVIQCDHTKLDILIVDKDGKVLGRPWLTIVVDSFSSCVLGFFLGLKQPGTEEVALALRHAALPKHYPDDYELLRPWDVNGLPLQYFFTDGGKDLSKAKHIQQIGRNFNFKCELRFNPPQGGIVERVFKTINSKVLQGLPGYTGSCVEDRPKHAEETACLTWRDVKKILTGFFCDSYNHDKHPKKKGMTRYEYWLEGLGGTLPEPIDEQELDLCLMKAAYRSVQAHGSVNFENVTYRSEELKNHLGERVTLRYDPDHILSLRAYTYEADEKMGELIDDNVKALNLEYQALTLDELKQINAKLTEEGKEIDNYTILQELGRRTEMVDEAIQNRNDRRRAAHKEARSEHKDNSTKPGSRKTTKKASVTLRGSVPPSLAEAELTAPSAPEAEESDISASTLELLQLPDKPDGTVFYPLSDDGSAEIVQTEIAQASVVEQSLAAIVTPLAEKATTEAVITPQVESPKQKECYDFIISKRSRRSR
ncbi:Mu transposase C-terminal domain-containing protein [Stenomitos frigidus]|nr:Mu transposase C-terminal domain-containing protein [Stenomitos frigidus]